MLDRYVVGEVQRISPDAPVPVLRPTHESASLGGAGNVALNLVALGVAVDCAGWVGDDQAGEDVRARFERAEVPFHALCCGARPTTTKTRVVAGQQQLLRIDDEMISPLPDDDRREWDTQVSELACGPYDAIVISDYAKGV